ncbi:SDR family NAD(P)-dependent oxidoreductase [Sphingobium sp. Sx8-8]|uniref:SDR family oxidoreductase n=1 Tax=Sphingobium sp. Sx8-8 TaxID=2933617 RepID=UPI001F567175|nr:SDR family NAD(P)-dependent oxidoreductase [Sphingobium sp. Sx8-8]
MEMTGNTILVTGGTSGIGRALAEQFHSRSNQVIIAGRRQPLLDEITAERPGIRGIQVDLDDEKSLVAFADGVAAEFPDLNMLVNNAGISREENIVGEDFDFATSREMIHTNILAKLQLTGLLLPVLRQQPTATIITTSSGLAFVPRHNFPTYCATKAFLHSWVQSLRTQLRETAIKVLELIPPYVQTELAGPDQARDPNAMPLGTYIAEVVGLLESGDLPNGEILVERVKQLRSAERMGKYDEVYSTLNAS